ncbi:hypothetical protein ABIE89_001639 [Bradyrhizobium niftali]|uniref:hypothetical protein n=1 Tax=Bradyrhizobium niftali TaxID=2560055 RepID=UPI003832D1C4
MTRQFLHVFHQGYGNNQELWHNVRTPDGAWLGDQRVPNTRLSYSPSPVVYGNKIFVFHQGCHPLFGENRGSLWYDVCDQSGTWAGDVQVPDTQLLESPSAVVYNNKIYVFHQGVGSNSGSLWFDVFDGISWAGDKPVPSAAGISASPSAVVFDNKIYVFHQGPGDNGQLWYNVFDGTTMGWTGGVVPNASMSSSPAAVVIPRPNKIITPYDIAIYYQGPGWDGHLGMSWFYGDTGQWGGGGRVSPQNMLSASPAVVYAPNQNEVYFNYIFFQGAGFSGQLFVDIFDPTYRFDPPTTGLREIYQTGLTDSPGVVALDW